MGFVATWVGTAGVSHNDNVFVAAFSDAGGQGTGKYIAAYKVGSGCRVFNVATGTVTGDYGPTGAVSNWKTMTDADGILLHDVQMSKAGDWVVINPHVPSCPSCASGIFFWQIDTLTATAASGNLSGHSTEGYSHWLNNNGTPIGQYRSRPFSAPGTSTAIIPTPSGFPVCVAGGQCPKAQFGSHAGWSNVDVNDTYPFFITTTYNVIPFLSAWYREVLGISPVNGTVWRFAHTFNSGNSQRFSTAQSIGAISQDGRFFLWSSDWMETLGSESGTSTCTSGVDCRGDVFVVQLQ